VYFSLRQERKGNNGEGRKGERKKLTKKLRSREVKCGREERKNK
jgi:hypothetical protein